MILRKLIIKWTFQNEWFNLQRDTNLIVWPYHGPRLKKLRIIGYNWNKFVKLIKLWSTTIPRPQ